jgi:myo-inositol-1(or 4)-monophosphatase
MQCMTSRMSGSAALALCYVGAARLDAYIHLSLSAWDVAAATLIAREGDARVTRPNGRAATLAGGAYLAANPQIFPRFLHLVKALDARR